MCGHTDMVCCIYRFKKEEERVPYITAMATFLPLLYSRMTQIIADHSLLSVTLQHHILKIFHATMQVLHNYTYMSHDSGRVLHTCHMIVM